MALAHDFWVKFPRLNKTMIQFDLAVIIIACSKKSYNVHFTKPFLTIVTFLTRSERLERLHKILLILIDTDGRQPN